MKKAEIRIPVSVEAITAIVAEYSTRALRGSLDAQQAALLVVAQINRLEKITHLVGTKGYIPPLDAVRFFPVKDRLRYVEELRRRADKLSRQALIRYGWRERGGRSPTTRESRRVYVRAPSAAEAKGWLNNATRKLKGAGYFISLAARIEKMEVSSNAGS